MRTAEQAATLAAIRLIPVEKHMLRTALRPISLLLIFIGTLPGGLLSADTVRLSEPVEATEAYETFGAPLPDADAVIDLGTLLENSGEYLDREVLVKTRVAQVCQAKGCFFIAQEGAHAARVSFKDYSFFVPSDISGRTVTLAGSLVRNELSEAQAEHLNEDAGGGNSIRSGAQYEFVASSVRVPRR
jgi:hypothetical protein